MKKAKTAENTHGSFSICSSSSSSSSTSSSTSTEPEAEGTDHELDPELSTNLGTEQHLCLDVPLQIADVLDMLCDAAYEVLCVLKGGYPLQVWKQAFDIALNKKSQSYGGVPLSIESNVKVEVFYDQKPLKYYIPVDFLVSLDEHTRLYVFIQRKESKLTQRDYMVMSNVQDQIYEQTDRQVKPWCLMLHFLPSTLRTLTLYDGKIVDDGKQDISL